MKYAKPHIFVSACLEFDSCRFDATMIADESVKRMKDIVRFYRVCPELMIGLGAPREAVRLVQKEQGKPQLLSSVKGIDYTQKMEAFIDQYIASLQTKDIDGFILKAKSPTCGVGDVKIYQGIGKAHLKSARNDGLYGAKIKEVFPNHPVETERRMSNYNIREHFFIQVFTMADFRELRTDFRFKKLVDFHSKNKYLFMSYNQSELKILGQLVANHDHKTNDEVLALYEEHLRLLLHQESSKKRRMNTLSHLYGYFKNKLSTSEKEYYFDAVDDYMDFKIPYSNILYILKGFAVRFNEEYLLQQTVFQPFPKELITVLDSGNKI